MIFCLLLVNLLSNEEQLDNLMDYRFPETSKSYLINIDQDYLDSLSSLCPHSEEEVEVRKQQLSYTPCNYFYC